MRGLKLLVNDDKLNNYISRTQFVKQSGSTQKRILKMCRSGELECINVGGRIYINKNELYKFLRPVPEGYIEVKEYADKYQYARPTVYQYIKARRLPCVTISGKLYVKDQLPNVEVRGPRRELDQ